MARIFFKFYIFNVPNLKKSDVGPEKLDICVHSLPKSCILMAFCRTSRHLKHVHNVGGKCICTKTEKGEEKRPLITAIIIFQTDMSVASGHTGTF